MEEKEITNVINEKVKEEAEKRVGPRNRAERRALEKKNRQKIKNRKYFVDSINDTAKKLVYADLIQKLREKNKEIEENERNAEQSA